MNPIKSYLNKKFQALEDAMRAEESQFESYRTLATLARSEHSMLMSDEAEEANKVELARLRVKFKDDPRSKIIDPLRDLEAA